MKKSIDQMTLNKTNALLAGAAALALLAACGGEETSTASSDQAATPATPTSQAPAEEAPAQPTVEDAAQEAEEAASDMMDAASQTAEAVENAANEAADNAADQVAAATAAATAAANQATESAQDVADEVTEAASQVADAAAGTVHEILMLNADPDNPRERMVFRPDLVVAKPGDTIRFVPTDLSHQSSSIDDMLPEGAEPWEGKINKGFDYTVTEPGVYGYKCVPHYAAGMVGLLIVEGDGMMDNVEAAKGVRQIGLAQRRFNDIWERAEADYLN